LKKTLDKTIRVVAILATVRRKTGRAKFLGDNFNDAELDTYKREDKRHCRADAVCQKFVGLYQF
jgi:hypothetical protein